MGTFHAVNDAGIVWYGGMGHRLLTDDDGGCHCYRCGMAADPDALQELIPDCAGPTGGGDHYWIAGPRGNECAYDGTLSTPDAHPVPMPCHRA